MPAEIMTHGALVCDACATCFRYQNGVLEFIKTRPHGLTRAQRSNFSRLVYRNYQEKWRRWIMSLLMAERFANRREQEWLLHLTARTTRDTLPAVDIGTAHGFYAVALAEAFKKTSNSQFVLAVDFSLGMLTEAVRAAERVDVQDRVLFILADVENLPLRDGVSDLITCGGGLNEYAHVATALAEVRRLLTPEGRFVAMHLHKAKGALSLFQDLIEHVSGLRFPEPEEWRQLFEQACLRQSPNSRKGIVSWTTLTP